MLDLLGPSLKQAFSSCGKKFSMGTIQIVAEGLLTSLQYVHSKGIIHGDIKPENIMIGRGSKTSQMYLVDFGCASIWDRTETSPTPQGRTRR